MPQDTFKFHWIPILKVRQTNHLPCACDYTTEGLCFFLHKLIPDLPVFHLELHLYEGFICCAWTGSVMSGWVQTGLQAIGWRNSKGVEVSDAWQASARTLLNRVFQKWSPSDKQSTERLCENLMHFTMSLDFAPQRVKYPDCSKPPIVKVGATKRADCQY